MFFFFFFFNDTATTEIYTLSLHDALPISAEESHGASLRKKQAAHVAIGRAQCLKRSEEHTSELQSQSNLVCRLLLEKKKPSSVRLTIGIAILIASRSTSLPRPAQRRHQPT